MFNKVFEADALRLEARLKFLALNVLPDWNTRFMPSRAHRSLKPSPSEITRTLISNYYLFVYTTTFILKVGEIIKDES